tara:strand:+ start:1203 stop:1313 length:111 start_codon:yes stop_codon:yes gene_type:complete
MIKFLVGFILGAILLYCYPEIGIESINTVKEVINEF